MFHCLLHRKYKGHFSNQVLMAAFRQGVFCSALWMEAVKVIIKAFNDSPQEAIIIW